jgi:uncharacterized membrane protein YedE/YeeE
MHILSALLTGLLFGIALIVSGMTDPSKVLGFLDLAGAWNPSLAMVMGGALLVGLPGFALAARRTRPLFGDAMRLPSSTRVDRRLVVGSVTFGIGWGLAGYCPGPVLASLAVGGVKPLIFFIAMLVGMGLFDVLERAQKTTPP